MRSQSGAVVAAIKEMIVAGRLIAGSRLPIEKDLALELGVSRGSLREGVRALAMMGVLETRQGDGTYVTSLEPAVLLGSVGLVTELHAPRAGVHLQAVRRVLEAEAASCAARRSDPVWLAEADAVLQRVDAVLAAAETGVPVDHRRFIDDDIAFHRIIARESGNPILESLINGLSGRTVRDRLWRAISESEAERTTHAEHRAILDALRRGDPDAARVRMTVHLYEVEDFLQDRLDAGPDQTALTTTTIADHHPWER